MSALPTTQKAWLVVRRGPPDVALELVHDAPVPTELQDGEVLVKVGAAALNPVGWKLMALLPNFIARRPHPAEFDFAGTVVASRAPGLALGAPVFGWLDVPTQLSTRQGALAQFVHVAADRVTPRPPGMRARDACGLGVAGVSAHQTLFAAAGVQPGQTVFVNGGSSSVGAFAIQLAKAKGCTVWASASGKNEEFVRSLGADEFVDYTTQPLSLTLATHPRAPKFHAIIDAIGLADSALFVRSPAYTTRGAVYAQIGLAPSLADIRALLCWVWATLVCPVWLGGTPRPFRVVMLAHRPRDLKELAQMAAEGALKPVVDSVFSFEDALSAYERIRTNRARGKVVIEIDADA